MRRGRLDPARLIAEEVQGLARPLATLRDLDAVMDRIGEAKLVLIGEASHGTSEFYAWRAQLTQRLVREKGFAFVAVEGDWPDCFAMDRFVKREPGGGGAGGDVREALRVFGRWPTWMWANVEVARFLAWLREHNGTIAARERVGFYGLDLYSLHDSMRAVLEYLDEHVPAAAQHAREAYACFHRYADPEDYAWATRAVPITCEAEVVSVLVRLQEERARAARTRPGGDESALSGEMNALVARNAERYYRTMVRSGNESWNVRDRHMMEVLERLLQHHGGDARGVVWAHNTHVGDARHTDMAEGGMVNLGQFARERFGEEDVVLVGFGSHRGSVIAGLAWGMPMQRMDVPPARSGSLEDILHESLARDALLVSEDADPEGALSEWLDHRAIGVVYDPARERLGNYVPTRLTRRYDVFLHLEEARALHPLHVPLEPGLELPETFPFGV